MPNKHKTVTQLFYGEAGATRTKAWRKFFSRLTNGDITQKEANAAIGLMGTQLLATEGLVAHHAGPGFCLIPAVLFDTGVSSEPTKKRLILRYNVLEVASISLSDSLRNFASAFQVSEKTRWTLLEELLVAHSILQEAIRGCLALETNSNLFWVLKKPSVTARLDQLRLKLK